MHAIQGGARRKDAVRPARPSVRLHLVHSDPTPPRRRHDDWFIAVVIVSLILVAVAFGALVVRPFVLR
jgi:hypothetical protein